MPRTLVLILHLIPFLFELNFWLGAGRVHLYKPDVSFVLNPQCNSTSNDDFVRSLMFSNGTLYGCNFMEFPSSPASFFMAMLMMVGPMIMVFLFWLFFVCSPRTAYEMALPLAFFHLLQSLIGVVLWTVLNPLWQCIPPMLPPDEQPSATSLNPLPSSITNITIKCENVHMIGDRMIEIPWEPSPFLASTLQSVTYQWWFTFGICCCLFIVLFFLVRLWWYASVLPSGIDHLNETAHESLSVHDDGIPAVPATVPSTISKETPINSSAAASSNSLLARGRVICANELKTTGSPPYDTETNYKSPLLGFMSGALQSD